MISKNTIKYVRALETKKARQREQCFVAEGPKVVADLMERTSPLRLFATSDWLASARPTSRCELTEVSPDELRKLSFLQHPQQVVGLFPLPCTGVDDAQPPLIDADTLVLALDGVQDPGNLGTIIRIADWFGIETILCSPDTADCYNPKVVQATMGSIARVRIVYTSLPSLLADVPADVPVYGTLLNGTSIYDQPLTPGGIIVMGNEGKGISPEVEQLVSRRLLIPSWPALRPTADSLNVAIATAITCAEFRRQQAGEG